MKKTVLITGASSGFGAATANYFASKGWNVIATMRDTNKNNNLNTAANIYVTTLDVQDKESIDKAIMDGINHFGSIDVVVNNAGYGLFSIFESASREAILTQFEVNVFGAMDVTRAILPHFRAKQAGTIINISSGAGAIGFPMASIYSASKFALEGWTEGVRYELASLGINVKIIEPGGATQTDFMNRVGNESKALRSIDDYLPFLNQIGTVYNDMQGAADSNAIEKVVEAIYEAATDETNRLRYAPTDDISTILQARRNTSEEEYQAFTDHIFLTK